MSVKPVLFSTDMVRAILDGRKTVTRRVVKFEKVFNGDVGIVYPGKCGLGVGLFSEFDNARVSKKPPYRLGDILYVRETWQKTYINDGTTHPTNFKYEYKASDEQRTVYRWRPSIHMAKEAARIWLKVTNVRVERLQDITEDQAKLEGENGLKYVGIKGEELSAALDWFPITWNSTVKKPDINRYGWETNPWVWVIEFERCEKPQEGNS